MTPLVTWLTTLGVCVVSAIFPFVNAEIYLLSVVALSPESLALPLALAATIGQMIGKVLMYTAARSGARLPGEWMNRKLAKAEAWLREREGIGGIALLSSATTGIPPFYAVTVACGLVRFRFLHFFAVGFLGRLVRFSAVVLLPQLVKH